MTSYSDGPALRSQVVRQAEKYDDVVIDVGGQDSATLRASLALTQTLLVPFRPRSFDVWGLAHIATLIDDARSVRDGLTAYAVLNAADPSNAGSDNREAAEALTDYPQLAYLDAPLRNRKAFANASGLGRSVLEAAPRDRDTKACAEIEALVSALF